ncbi:hypothetical protein AWC22_01350 [Mycobacterium riyadhense]|uniref:Uncharacterized protein n=1 Tax=Mycobacterium riyadhense TaxID=486698 RepID=A0A1X2CBA5_9MYCO|nr:hypothetical protein AWC22_01350 [Mycobacterium riyadhense]
MLMPGQTTPAERARTLLELHQPGDPVVPPTVWDAWSARLATDAGFGDKCPADAKAPAAPRGRELLRLFAPVTS